MGSLSPVTIAEKDERAALVQRVAVSRHFARAHQLRDILTYLAGRALAEAGAPVREQEIACSVLGRRPGFDPHEDNIVRVQMSHLRKRLEDYYAQEGAGETLRITVPKGAYAVQFETRVPASTVSAAEPSAAVPDPVASSSARRLWWWPALVLSGLIAIAAGLRAVGVAAAPASPAPEKRDSLLWSALFNGQPVSIVVADTCLVMLQDILDTDISVADYLHGQYPENLLKKVPDAGLQRALRLIAARQYTSLADLNSSSQLLDLSRHFGPGRPSVRYARHMNVRDFKSGNFILAGSRRGIPWVRLFENQLNFLMEEDPHTRGYYFRNKAAKSGEQAAYSQTTGPDGTVDTYADIALAPNLGNTGYALLLNGIGMEASEAAGELVVKPDFNAVLTGILPKNGNRPELRPFEILIRTRAVAGAARNSQVVASRILPFAPAGN